MNLTGRVPMDKTDIEFGIELGKKMIDDKNNSKINLLKRLKCRIK